MEKYKEKVDPAWTVPGSPHRMFVHLKDCENTQF